MKKRLSFLITLFSLSLLAGCAAAPDKTIVRQKTGSAAAYQEATEADSSSSAQVSSDALLSARLSVPDTYTANVTSSDGVFHLTCNASISVPETDHVSIWNVKAKEFSQDWIDSITQAFFGDAPIYDYEAYTQPTKAQILEKLDELKAYQQQGNLDPYGVIASARNGNSSGDVPDDQIYSLQQEIDSWEEAYQTAPETVEKKLITPGFSTSDDSGSLQSDCAFFGLAETDDGSYYYSLTRDTAGDATKILVNRIADGNQTCYWNALDIFSDSPEVPSAEKVKEMAGIPSDEATAITDALMKKLGLTDFSPRSVVLAVGSQVDTSDSENLTSYPYGGWMLSYTRSVDGFPVTDEDNYGGGLESMESTIEPWCYEKVTFYVNKEGLWYAELSNFYELTGQQTQNTQLLSFPEISSVFEKMLPIQQSSTEMTENDISIDHVTLGYMRIYDPNTDPCSGVLVPVWDFFGSSTQMAVYEGTELTSSFSNPRSSYLTINAADGTIIDRFLGY